MSIEESITSKTETIVAKLNLSLNRNNTSHSAHPDTVVIDANDVVINDVVIVNVVILL